MSGGPALIVLPWGEWVVADEMHAIRVHEGSEYVGDPVNGEWRVAWRVHVQGAGNCILAESRWYEDRDAAVALAKEVAMRFCFGSRTEVERP